MFLFAALLPATPILLAQSDRAARGWFRCDTNTGGDTIYATPFFDWTGTFADLQNAFEQHLLAKYGYKGRVSCSMAYQDGNTPAKLQADMQRQYTQFRAQGKQIVELSWTILSPGVTLAYQCFGLAKVRRAGVPDSSYLLHSEVVRHLVDNGGELARAWIDELKRLHPGWYFQSPGCNLLPADPAKYPAFLNSMVEMWAGSKPKVVQLDWQYRAGSGRRDRGGGQAARVLLRADRQHAEDGVHHAGALGRSGVGTDGLPVRLAAVRARQPRQGRLHRRVRGGDDEAGDGGAKWPPGTVRQPGLHDPRRGLDLRPGCAPRRGQGSGSSRKPAFRRSACGAPQRRPAIPPWTGSGAPCPR